MLRADVGDHIAQSPTVGATGFAGTWRNFSGRDFSA
jgi:hypothetical protein